MNLDPADPLARDFRAAVADALDAFWETQTGPLAELQPTVEPMVQMARDYTAGGKRLRPAFCTWGYGAASAFPDDTQGLLQAASSLELLHVSALMHDDVMDDSATRRGLPAAHVRLAAAHRERGGAGDPDAFGRAGAILLGDLLLVWSAEMFDTASLPPERLAAARRLLHLVRTEVTAGQFLDVDAQTWPLTESTTAAIAAAERVVEFKSARYTVTRPLQIGAALAGGSAELIAALARFGSPLGRAFQYRDDVLGVFGDEAATGKPAGDDLREGKRTVLLAAALDGLDAADRSTLASLVGRSDLAHEDVQRARGLIRSSGALDRVESIITERYDEALAALDQASLRRDSRVALQALAAACVDRSA